MALPRQWCFDDSSFRQLFQWWQWWCWAFHSGLQCYNVLTMEVFVRYKTERIMGKDWLIVSVLYSILIVYRLSVLYLMKTFVVEMLYCYNLLCYVKYLTSLLTFKAVAMCVYYVTSSTSLLTFKAVAMTLYYVTSSTSLLTFKAIAMCVYYVTSSTSLLTFKAVAMTLYFVTSSTSLLTFKAEAMCVYYLTSSTSLLTFKVIAVSLYHVTSSDAHVLWLQWMSQLPTNLWFCLGTYLHYIGCCKQE